MQEFVYICMKLLSAWVNMRTWSSYSCVLNFRYGSFHVKKIVAKHSPEWVITIISNIEWIFLVFLIAGKSFVMKSKAYVNMTFLSFDNLHTNLNKSSF